MKVFVVYSTRKEYDCDEETTITLIEGVFDTIEEANEYIEFRCEPSRKPEFNSIRVQETLKM